ncbi:unnamed protein product [Cuscuta europaea]|uniref:EF-hand domain-containing protein n=1 Tax=Cuscuta europaea TaxID=41803 RepID=A0A9P0ZHW9_CUSEU|nr:unnamed protein product [Cuscuta europaea]
MKLIKSISNPKKLFKSKLGRLISRSDDPTSISSGSASGSSDFPNGSSKKPQTPTSVLPVEFHADVYSELVQAFHLIDRDGDGKIQKSELAALLSLFGAEPPSEEEIDTMMGEVDRDGDGCISLEEFAALRPAFAPPACGSEMRDTFDFFDTNGDGKISAEELFNVFKTIGDGKCTLEECQRMIRGVDQNEDGFVCFEDFSRMMELRI